jgi:hypothetical protein
VLGVGVGDDGGLDEVLARFDRGRVDQRPDLDLGVERVSGSVPRLRPVSGVVPGGDGDLGGRLHERASGCHRLGRDHRAQPGLLLQRWKDA